MNTFESNSNPTILITGGGGGAPKVAQGITRALPDARVVLVQGGADRGGSSKLLRDELDIAAPGDFRNGIAAFAGDTESAISNYRFGPEATVESVRQKGDEFFSLVQARSPELDAAWLAMQLDAADELAEDLASDGHSLEEHAYGNLVIGSSAWYTGSIGEAIKFSSTLMGLPENRIVLPSTEAVHDLELHDRDEDGNEIVILGEGDIDTHHVIDHEYAYTLLTPDVPINPEYSAELSRADALLISAGSWDTSVKPPLQVQGFSAAIADMKPSSKVFALANITEEPVRDSMDLSTFIDKLEELTDPVDKPGRKIDHVLFHNAPHKLPVGVKPIAHDAQQLEQLGRVRVAIGGDLLDQELAVQNPLSTVIRSKVHHCGVSIARLISTEISPSRVTSDSIATTEAA